MKYKILLIFAVICINSSLFADVTFKVDDVEVTKDLLKEESVYSIVFKKYGQPEDFSEHGCKLINTVHHSFVETVSVAYAKHHPISISPDHVWLMICQGLSCHINQNPEKYRKLLVNHQDKKTITVVRNGFVKGSLDNDWEGVFPEFCEKMEKFMTPYATEMLVTEFSTTGILEKAAFEISMMETMKNYFSYLLLYICGIPEITLEGEVQDWELIIKKLDLLDKVELQWWTKELRPVIQEFVSASKGKPNKEFWQSIFKDRSVGCGNLAVTGWVNYFFPYLQSGSLRDFYKNPIFESKLELSQLQTALSSFPDGMSTAPFIWDYMGMSIPMKLMAGFMGTKQNHKTKSLRPEIGWIVQENQKGINAKNVYNCFQEFDNAVYKLMQPVTRVRVVDITGDKENESIIVDMNKEDIDSFCRMFGSNLDLINEEIEDSFEDNFEEDDKDYDDYDDGGIYDDSESTVDSSTEPLEETVEDLFKFSEFFAENIDVDRLVGDNKKESVGNFRFELYRDEVFLTSFYVFEGSVQKNMPAWFHTDLKAKSYIKLYCWLSKHGLHLRLPVMNFLNKCIGETVSRNKLLTNGIEELQRLREERYPIQRAFVEKYFTEEELKKTWNLFEYDSFDKESKTFVATWVKKEFERYGVFFSSEILKEVYEIINQEKQYSDKLDSINFDTIDDIRATRYPVQKDELLKKFSQQELVRESWKMFRKSKLGYEDKLLLSLSIRNEFDRYRVFFSGSILEAARSMLSLSRKEFAELFLKSNNPELLNFAFPEVTENFKKSWCRDEIRKELTGELYNELWVKILKFTFENKLPSAELIKVVLDMNNKDILEIFSKVELCIESDDINYHFLTTIGKMKFYENCYKAREVIENVLGVEQDKNNYVNTEELIYLNMLSDRKNGDVTTSVDEFIETIEDDDKEKCIYGFNRNFIVTECYFTKMVTDSDGKEVKEYVELFQLLDSQGNMVFDEEFNKIKIYPNIELLDEDILPEDLPLKQQSPNKILAFLEGINGKQFLLFYRNGKLEKKESNVLIVMIVDNKIVYKENGLIGVMDVIGNILIEPKYSSVGWFSENLCSFSVKSGDEGSRKYGYLNRSFEQVISTKFDYACEFSEGMAVVKSGDKGGIVNRLGDYIVPPVYDSWWNIKMYKSGQFSVKKDGKWGVIDKTGKMIVPIKYPVKVEWHQGYTLVYYNYDKIGILDPDGKPVNVIVD